MVALSLVFYIYDNTRRDHGAKCLVLFYCECLVVHVKVSVRFASVVPGTGTWLMLGRFV